MERNEHVIDAEVEMVKPPFAHSGNSRRGNIVSRSRSRLE